MSGANCPQHEIQIAAQLSCVLAHGCGKGLTVGLRGGAGTNGQTVADLVALALSKAEPPHGSREQSSQLLAATIKAARLFDHVHETHGGCRQIQLRPFLGGRRSFRRLCAMRQKDNNRGDNNVAHNAPLLAVASATVPVSRAVVDSNLWPSA